MSLSFVTFRVSRFHISHLTHETFKLHLQNTLTCRKRLGYILGVLHELLPLDTEINRTLRGLRKVKSAEIAMADKRVTQPVNQEFAAEVPQGRDTMEDFWRPVIQDEYSVVRQPAIDANNFELKLALITMVQQNQFTDHPSEDPNEHLGRFMRIANTVKLNGVRPEVIKLQLFPFSLRDIAATWFDSLPYGSVNTWEELMEAYLSRFFPPSLTYEQREEITTFKQGEDEIQEATEEMSHARDRSEDTNGHLLPLNKLYLKRYNRCSLRWSIQKKKSRRSKTADRGSC